MNKTAMNIHVQVFLCMYAVISPGINYSVVWVYMHSFTLEMEFLGHMILTCLTLYETLFQTFYNFITLFINVWEFQLLRCITIGLIRTLNFSHSKEYEMVSQCAFNLCFPDDFWLNNVGSLLNVNHLFMLLFLWLCF